MEQFLLAFIPLFVAIDPVGTIPLFLGLTQGFTDQERRVLAYQAVGTALAVGVLFGAAGNWIFSVLGITPADFKIAGGLLLVIFSIREIFGTTVKHTEGEGSAPDKFVGIVPLGIPLIAGPAMITTVLILRDDHGYFSTLFALVVNLLIALVVLINSARIMQKLGEVTSRVTSKVVAIFLAAIGIMMIRKGLSAFFF